MIAATVPLLQIAALFQLSDGTQAIGAGALRGLGDTRATLCGNLLGHYAIGAADHARARLRRRARRARPVVGPVGGPTATGGRSCSCAFSEVRVEADA